MARRNPKSSTSSNDRKMNRKGGNKPFTRNKDAFKEGGPKSAAPVQDKLSSLNDISWYSRNPELLAAAAMVPTPYRPGMYVPWGNGTTGNTSWVNKGFDIPGVMAIYFNYSVGYSADITSPASIAAKEMYGRIRKAYSGALDADAPDIFMYALALDSIHSYIAYLKRIYRCIMAYSPQNRATPLHLLAAMGLSSAMIDKLLPNRTKLWGEINLLVHMVNKFTVPLNMDLYLRHRWMNENVYLDNDSMASQMFVFVPNFFWQIDETDPNGTALIPVAAPTDPDLFYAYGKALIDALSNWDDAYTINGYMERAFEGETFYKADLLGQDEVQSFSYVPEVLSQIQNSESAQRGTKSNLTVTYTGFNVTQDPNTYAIIHTPRLTYSSTWNMGVFDTHMMNLDSTVGTPADTVIATRLKVSEAVVPNTGSKGWNLYGGTEIVTDYGLVLSNLTVSKFYSYMYFGLTTNNDVDFADFTLNMSREQNLTAFNHAPTIFYVLSGSNASYIKQQWVNPTSFTANQLQEINRVCVFSEFNCFRSGV